MLNQWLSRFPASFLQRLTWLFRSYGLPVSRELAAPSFSRASVSRIFVKILQRAQPKRIPPALPAMLLGIVEHVTSLA